MLYGRHSGVAVYLYRMRVCIYTNNRSTCVYVIERYMCYTVDTVVLQYTRIGVGYVYTFILVDVYTCYREVHVLYGRHSGVAVYIYRLCIFTHISRRVYMLRLDTCVIRWTQGCLSIPV